MALRALPDGFRDLTRGWVRLLAHVDVCDALVLAGALDGVALEALGEVIERLAGGRESMPVLRVTGIDTDLAAKTIHRGGVLGPLLGTNVTVNRAFAEVLHAASVRHAGVPAPPIVAARLTRTLVPGAVRVDLFTPYIHDARNLEQYLRAAPRDAARRRVLRDAGRAIRSLHEAGVRHPDLNVRNLLVDGVGVVHVIDLGKGGRAAGGGSIKDLARLCRSAIKRGMIPVVASRTDVLRFLTGYDANNWRAIWRDANAVLRRSLPMHRVAWRLFG